MNPHEMNPAASALDAGGSMSLAGLMNAPWALTGESFATVQAFFDTYTGGPKIDIKGTEKNLGFSLATPRTSYASERGVAIIKIDGLLMPKDNLLTRIGMATSAQWVTSQIKQAVNDARVKSIILLIDSHGGTSTGSPELAAYVFEAATKKPLVAFSDGHLLSAAYWVASAANAVVISGPTVFVGGIGITAKHTHSPIEGRTEIVAGSYKRITSPQNRLSAPGVEYLRGQVNHLYSIFVNAVALYRGATSEHVNTMMADGRSFIGKQAVDVGLVDQITPLSALVNAMASTPDAFARRRRVAAHRVVMTPISTPSVAQAQSPVTPPADAKRVSIYTPPRPLYVQAPIVPVAPPIDPKRNIVRALEALGFLA